MLRTFALILVLGALPVPARAQQPAVPPVDTAVIELRLTDGSTIVGRIVAAGDTACTVQTAAGLTVFVPRGVLAGWHRAGAATAEDVSGPPDPGRTRLFLAPTARTLASGQGYAGDYYVFFPVVGYGIADRFMLSGGMSLIPGLTFDEQLVYLAPKVALVRGPHFSLAAGGLFMRLQWADFVSASGGVGYGVATLGDDAAALTLGLGWPLGAGAHAQHPWIMGGAEYRLSRSVKLLAEGWRFPGSSEVPVVGGIRFIEARVAVDIGLVQVVGQHDIGIVPWVDFSVLW